MDLALVILIMVSALPLMLVIAVAVSLNSPGPVLIRQLRYGLNGEKITLYKFRSTTYGDESSVVTLVGRFLRKTSLDELPRIFNVLNGTMGFVGPQPLTRPQYDLYRLLIRD
jgi:putative colanic acid biosynthesis UDP-glucose lipid carrier transferase